MGQKYGSISDEARRILGDCRRRLSGIEPQYRHPLRIEGKANVGDAENVYEGSKDLDGISKATIFVKTI